MYLIDTNIVSEARRGSSEATSWLRSVDPKSVFLSVITLSEVMRGIALRQKSDPKATAPLALWLETLRQAHAGRVLPITDRIAVEWGRLGALRPRGDADGLIGATAIVHGLVIVTRNVRDFDDVGVALVNPWEVFRS